VTKIPCYACTLQNTNKGNKFNKLRVRRGKPGSKQAFSEWFAKVIWFELYQTDNVKKN
jgi:hypothetical protein